MPIRMNTILIGAYFPAAVVILHLLHNEKPIIMKPNFSNSRNMTLSYPYELLKECGRGDQKAQLQVYKLYYKQIFSICLQIIPDRRVAEELMHESFLLAFENISLYAGNTSFLSWLMTFIKDALKHGDN